MTTTTTDAMLQRVRDICFDFPESAEKLSHGMPFFHVRGRGFLYFTHDRHGAGRPAVWCKSTLDTQRRLVASHPDDYFVPPYVGVNGWVGVYLDVTKTHFEALAILVEEAWRSVAPKRPAAALPTAARIVPTYPTTDAVVVREALARLTRLCNALPGTTSEHSPSQVVFRAGKKPYAYFYDNVHRDGIVAVCFKLQGDEGDALLARATKRYYRPAYLGVHGWIAMHLDDAKVPWKTVERHVVASYERVMPRAKTRR